MCLRCHRNGEYSDEEDFPEIQPEGQTSTHPSGQGRGPCGYDPVIFCRTGEYRKTTVIYSLQTEMCEYWSMKIREFSWGAQFESKSSIETRMVEQRDNR